MFGEYRGRFMHRQGCQPHSRHGPGRTDGRNHRLPTIGKTRVAGPLTHLALKAVVDLDERHVQSGGAYMVGDREHVAGSNSRPMVVPRAPPECRRLMDTGPVRGGTPMHQTFSDLGLLAKEHDDLLTTTPRT